MKFDQLIEYNMRNIILEKSYTYCGGEASPRSFYKKSKLSISLDQQSEMLYGLFLLHVQYEVYQNINTKVLTSGFYLIKSFFKKNKKMPGSSLCTSFMHDF